MVDHLGAVIVKNGKVLARGHNQVVKNNDPTCHGEMQAIRAAVRSSAVLILVVVIFIQQVNHALCVWGQSFGQT